MSTTRSLNSTATTSNPKQQNASLAKRLLFPGLPSNNLPPLLASQDLPQDLHAELYDFIALALRAFVNPWWTKITRYDKEFLPEITSILTVVVRNLETRLLAADLPAFVLNDLAAIITQHYRDYRNAASKVSTSYASGGAASLQQLFHQLQPHMAVSADGQLSDEYFRQIIEHILKASLPPEDYEPETERFIVREVILKVLLNDIVPKVTQPWFILKLITDLLPPDGKVKSYQVKDPPSRHKTTLSFQSFSFHTCIVLFLSAIQSISGLCLAVINASKRAHSTITRVNQSLPPSRSTPRSSPQLQSPPAVPAPGPIPMSPIHSESSSSSSFMTHAPSQASPANEPIYEQLDDFLTPPLIMVSEILSTNDRLAASTITHSIIALTSLFSSFLHRLIPHLFSSVLSTQFKIDLVRKAKITLFPNGYPAPPPPDPSPEEQAAMWNRVVSFKGQGAAANFLLPLLLGADSSITLGYALEPLSSRACNVHLLVVILDRIIAVLFPELCG